MISSTAVQQYLFFFLFFRNNRWLIDLMFFLMKHKVVLLVLLLCTCTRYKQHSNIYVISMCDIIYTAITPDVIVHLIFIFLALEDRSHFYSSPGTSEATAITEQVSRKLLCVWSFFPRWSSIWVDEASTGSQKMSVCKHSYVPQYHHCFEKDLKQCSIVFSNRFGYAQRNRKE